MIVQSDLVKQSEPVIAPKIDHGNRDMETIKAEILANGLQGVSMSVLYPLRPKSDEIHVSVQDMGKETFANIVNSELSVESNFNPTVNVHTSWEGTANAVITWNTTQTKLLSGDVKAGGTILLHWGRSACYGNFYNPRCHIDLNTHWLTRMAPILNDSKVTCQFM